MKPDYLKGCRIKDGMSYLKRFRIKDEMTSMEDLRSYMQKSVQMGKLLKRNPMIFLTDGITFWIDGICDTEISYSGILWAEGIDAKHSCLHMKDGQTYTLPFGPSGLAHFLLYSDELSFVRISQYNFVPIGSIEKVSRKELYLKGCDTPFKIGAAYFKDFYYSLYNYLSEEVSKQQLL